MNRIFEFIRLGEDLRAGLPAEIEEASRTGRISGAIQRIKSEVRGYFGAASRYSTLLVIIAFAPFLAVIALFGQKETWTLIYICCALWTLGVGGFAITLLWPVFAVADCLRKLPDAVYWELIRPLWFNLDVLSIALNGGLLFYIGSNWTIKTSWPILAIAGFLWLFAPCICYLARQEKLLIKIRLFQLVSLFLLTLIVVLSPIPMKQYQWKAQREVAKTMRPFSREEITASWENLQWFTEEGEPNVWYSVRRDHDYHLFSAPGFDPETNQELKTVSDLDTKAAIVAALSSQKETLSDRQTAERRERLVHDFVCPGYQGQSAKKGSTALVVINSRGKVDSALADDISGALAEGGVPTECSIFTPAFVDSPQFQDILAGRRSASSDFPIQDYARYLLVIRIATSFSREAALGSVPMAVADTTWNVELISTFGLKAEHSYTIRTRGIGSNEGFAEENARQHAKSQLTEVAPSFSPSR
jgi:hypothetical protein